MYLGKKQFSSMVDNQFGKKLGIPTNSLGNKLMNSSKRQHLHHNTHEPNKPIPSPLEKR